MPETQTNAASTVAGAMSHRVTSERPPRISLAAAWVVFCAYLNCAGWVLSAMDQLNPTGYAVTLALGLGALFVWRMKTGVRFPVINLVKWRRRFRRPFPLGFLVLATLAILGGVLHPPSNYDALAYRTPRVLHWLAEGQWHWIHTEFHRLNTRGCGIEWVTAPLIALARTDRFFFLINAICFVLLPGRVFSLWTHLGVRPRVAWHWMWLLPTGYCYLLQAGSIANDLFGAVMALLAVEFALRARQSRRVGHLWVAMLAAGLMTAGKAFNLLLLLPWAVAAWPSVRLLLCRPLASMAMLAMAAGASLLPMAVLNHRHCGDWTGQAAERVTNLGSGAPMLRPPVNAVLLALHNFVPPIFPAAGAWNGLMARVVPPELSTRLRQNFEVAGAGLQVPEMQMEESAGLGMGVSVLLVAALLYRWRHRSRASITVAGLVRGAFRVEWLVPLCTAAGVGVFMTQSGLGCPARYLAPFYPLLIAPVLTGSGGQSRLERSRWWRRAGIAVFLLGGLLLVVSPSRPLWPAVTVLRGLGADQSSHSLVKRAWKVYSVYGQRADAFEPIRAMLPADADPLGMVTADDPETSMWRPFGSRRILHVCRADGPEELRRHGINYVLVNSFVVTQHYPISMDEWLARYQAEPVQRLTLHLRAGSAPSEWWLVKVHHGQK